MDKKSYLENLSKSIDNLISDAEIEEKTASFVNGNVKEIKQIYKMIHYAVSLNKDCFENEQKMPKLKDYKIPNNQNKSVEVDEKNFFSFLFSNNEQIFERGYKRRKENFMEKEYGDLDFSMLTYNHERVLETNKNIQLLTKNMFENLWMISKINVFDKKFNYDKWFKFDEQFYFKTRYDKTNRINHKPKNYSIEALIIGPVQISGNDFSLKVEYSDMKSNTVGMIKKKQICEKYATDYVIGEKDIKKYISKF